MFLHRNDQKMTTFNYFGPRILFVRPERTVGNNGLNRSEDMYKNFRKKRNYLGFLASFGPKKQYFCDKPIK